MPEKKTVPTQRVSVLRGVGPKTETLLQRMGIETLADLFAHYPLRFVTYPELTEIGALSADDAGTPVAVCAEPVRELVRRSGHSMQLCTGTFSRESSPQPGFICPICAKHFDRASAPYSSEKFNRTEIACIYSNRNSSQESSTKNCCIALFPSTHCQKESVRKPLGL